MASTIKTASGTWKAYVRKQGFPPQIKTFRTKRDAEDWARRVEDEIVRGVYIVRAPAEKTTVKNALQRYLTEISPTKKSVSTRKVGTAKVTTGEAAIFSAAHYGREAIPANALATELGRYSLAAVTPDMVAEYRDKRLATVSKKTGKALSPYTVRLELALLSHLFTVAIQEWGMGLTYNPVKNIRKPAAPKGRDRRLSATEEIRLLAECAKCSNPFLSSIVILGIETSMRKGEIQSLRRQDVDLDTRVALARDTKNGDAIRAIPLTVRAAEALRSAVDTPIPRPKGCDLVFFGDAGGKYHFEEAWETARDNAGLEGLRFHDLRHEAVSRLVEAGLTDQEVASISGHKTMQMLKRYTHLRAEDLVKRLDQVAGKQS
ncbi:MAG: site-specific integrase [Rhodocyclaceae bacterium]|nr:site-specific integrase [Rhodocyclaceae bacterium]